MARSAERDVLMQHRIAHLVPGIAQFVSGVVHAVFQYVHDFMQRVVMVFVVSGFVSSVGHGKKLRETTHSLYLHRDRFGY
jgi:hypothetical protein